MQTVTFYSYKGGVGRSLLLVNAARFLALTGRKVVALDLDFEAPGLHYKFGVDAQVQAGAVGLLERSLAGELPSLAQVRAATLEVTMPASAGGWLRLLAAGPAPAREYWADLGALDGRTSSNADVGLLEATLDLLARIEEAWAPDVLLIDARTGITGLGGIATMALADVVVLLTTRAKESVEGVQAVAQGLRDTPTLRTGERRIEFVVARVQGTEAVGDAELNEALGKEWFMLPNDAVDGGAERMLGGHDYPQPRGDRERRSASHSLLVRTLDWIARLFPSEAELAQRAQRRLIAVERAWDSLTQTSERIGKVIRTRDCWPVSALATGVRVDANDGSSRTADIVASLDGSPAMIIEYVDDEDWEAVARWWATRVGPRVIALFGQEHGRKLFAVDAARKVRASDRWYLPTPGEFELLDDPGDLPIENLLWARQHDRYSERLLAEWVRSYTIGLHGGLPWQPERARKILDGLADDGASALWLCSRGPSEREAWVYGGDDYLDHIVHENLCAPLCWRVHPQGFVEASIDHSFGPPPAIHGLRRLAAFMGLTYDPDAVFRREAPKLVDGDIYKLRDVFQHRELSYEWSEQPLDPHHERLAAKSPYHGYLGSYAPATGHVLLAAPAIESVAEAIAREPRHVGSLALLHLSVLGLLHNGVDLDGRRWEGFSVGDPSPWTGGVPPAIVVLAQLFMHRFLLELDDEQLLTTFEALSDRQAPEYRAWRRMTHVSLEAARAWMSAMRRGTGDRAPIDLDAVLASD